MAYCVPGRHARIVLSQGTLDLLSPRELQAVIRHERTHEAAMTSSCCRSSR
ncbi:M48 family metalloprotease [Streptosporangium album]|uniref:M48 family metalloprotease n=1 Tax=Streptosporangium album TaxID=47479 RepID=UPI001620D826